MTIGPLLARRRGFTLVELMATMAIIGILSGALIVAMRAGGEAAKRAHTQQLIAKLNSIIMPRYEAYQTQRVPIVISQQTIQQFGIRSPNGSASQKLWALREMMRMEMPDQYNDLRFTPQSLVDTQGNPIYPDLWRAYRQFISNSQPGSGGSGGGGGGGGGGANVNTIIANAQVNWERAECLYMVVTLGSEPEQLATLGNLPGPGQKFSNLADVGDLDQDGMPEFLDGWGNPICWFRWPAGFSSPLQPLVSVSSATPGFVQFPKSQAQDPNQPGNILTRFPPYSAQGSSADPVNRFLAVSNDDPFDPLKVDTFPRPNTTNGVAENGYALFPLIVSAGPNGDPTSGAGSANGFGLYFLFMNTPNPGGGVGGHNPDSDPYNVYKANDKSMRQQAEPMDGARFDNIDNQTLGNK
jgi:prepilin-type N-terminal cleavage/methylation domain-containing protein